MEVHHRAHSSPDKGGTSRKKWTHYFWEFIMLFLAVFCGFLAENFREHYIEDQRAVKHAKNLYKELYNDSVLLQRCLANRERKESECLYFMDYVRDSNLATLSPRFFPAFTSAIIQNQYIIFEPNDGILNQLRNSGELRYFKERELQAELGNLSAKIGYVKTRNDKEYSFVEFYTRPLALKYFDFQWYEKLTKKGSLTLIQSLEQYRPEDGIGKLRDPNKFDRNEAEGIASYYLVMMRATRQVAYKEYAQANQKVMALLRKEYHLK
jgi:hypothetical protein